MAKPIMFVFSFGQLEVLIPHDSFLQSLVSKYPLMCCWAGADDLLVNVRDLV